MSAVKRPALRYHGGKWRQRKWIVGYFPSHITYCEVYGGAASALLEKGPSKVEVYNDLDGDVVNYFKALRNSPRELVRAISLTPYSRTELEIAYQATDDELERARRFYVRAYQGRGGAVSAN